MTQARAGGPPDRNERKDDPLYEWAHCYVADDRTSGPTPFYFTTLRWRNRRRSFFRDRDRKMNDLEGFVLFEIRSGLAADLSVSVILTVNYLRLTTTAFRQLGSPEFVNVFFDEHGKRMMLKKADKRNQNIVKVDQKTKSISSVSLRMMIQKISGVEASGGHRFRLDGYNPHCNDTVIFDLAKPREVTNG